MTESVIIQAFKKSESGTTGIDINTAIKHMYFIMEGHKTGLFEVRARDKMPDAGTLTFFFSDLVGFENWLKSNKNNLSQCEFVYVGVHPRNDKRGKAENILSANVLYADFDAMSADKAREIWLDLYLRFDFRPSLMVNSGHGTHFYWKVEFIYSVKKGNKNITQRRLLSVAEWNLWERALFNFLKANYDQFKPDKKVCEPARCMRLAGTFNNKYEKPILTGFLQPEDFSVYDVNHKSFQNLFLEFSAQNNKGLAQMPVIVPHDTAESTKEKIIKIIVPYWKEKHRHSLTLALAGKLRRDGFLECDVKAMITAICDQANDNEKDDRIKAVEFVFRTEKIAGERSLVETLKEASA